jgi:hypothetical protein
MRFFSYVLVALATTAYAVPLFVRSDDIIEARTPYVVDGKDFGGKERIANVRKEFVQRRRDENEGAIVERAG